MPTLSLDPPSKVLPSIRQPTQWQQPVFAQLYMVDLVNWIGECLQRLKHYLHSPHTTGASCRIGGLPAATTLQSRTDCRTCGDFPLFHSWKLPSLHIKLFLIFYSIMSLSLPLFSSCWVFWQPPLVSFPRTPLTLRTIISRSHSSHLWSLIFLPLSLCLPFFSISYFLYPWSLSSPISLCRSLCFSISDKLALEDIKYYIQQWEHCSTTRNVWPLTPENQQNQWILAVALCHRVKLYILPSRDTRSYSAHSSQWKWQKRHYGLKLSELSTRALQIKLNSS